MTIRRASVLATTSTALLAGALITALPAAADTPTCVSNGEYGRVSVDMKMKRVHEIFDIKGIGVGGGEALQIRAYRACGDPSGTRNISVSYVERNNVWRVSEKMRTE